MNASDHMFACTVKKVRRGWETSQMASLLTQKAFAFEHG